MKNTLKQLTAFVFALLVIGSTTATAMSFHLCGGALTDAALFSKAQGCGMHHHTPKSDEAQFSKKPCCVNDSINFNSNTSLLIEKNHNIEAPMFIVPKSVILTYVSILVNKNQQIYIHNNSPPLRKNTLYKEYQVYRI